MNMVYTSRCLRAPESYVTAPDEVRNRICNGAGPAGWGALVPDTLWGLRIREAADIHDWMYEHGIDDEGRLFADLIFLQNLLMLVRDRTTQTPILRPILLFLRIHRAATYYWAVRVGGEAAFWANKLGDAE